MSCEEIELLVSPIHNQLPLAVLLTIELYDMQHVTNVGLAVAIQYSAEQWQHSLFVMLTDGHKILPKCSHNTYREYALTFEERVNEESLT